MSFFAFTDWSVFYEASYSLMVFRNTDNVKHIHQI